MPSDSSSGVGGGSSDSLPNSSSGEEKGCGGSLLATQGLFLASLVAFVALIIKKRGKD